MKTLGRTEQNDFIVEMSAYEHRTFNLIVQAVDGHNFNDLLQYNLQEKPLNRDIAKALEAIRLWVALRFRVNELQDDIKRLKSILTETSRACADESEA